MMPDEKAKKRQISLFGGLPAKVLTASARQESIGALHLNSRAGNALAARGVHSVGNLVDEISRGTLRLFGPGSTSLHGIYQALAAIFQSIGPDGTVDWDVYASRRNFLMLPGTYLKQWSMRDFIRAFPEVTKTAIESKYSDRESLIFSEYLLKSEPRTTSLRRLASKLHCTAQAATLIKNNLVTLLRKTMLEGDYTGCRFHFRVAFLGPLQRMKGMLAAFKGSPLLYSVWQQILIGLVGRDLSEVEQIESLLLSLLNYRVVVSKGTQFEPILLPLGSPISPLRVALAKSDRLLRIDHPSGLSEEEIFSKVAVGSGENLSLHEVAALLSSIRGVERVKGQGRCRVNLEGLTKITDQLERILTDKGSAMHGRELATELAHFKGGVESARSARNIAAAMSEDSRFKPVGRSGYWVLSVWDHLETRRVVDIAIEVITRAGRPVTEKELYEVISPRRPVKRKSILTLLREDGRFFRVGPGTWKLI